MDDVRSLVKLVERVPTPDLWQEIGSRSPSPLPPAPGRGRRAVAAVVALAVAAAGFALAYESLVPADAPPGGESPSPSVTTPPLIGEPTFTAEIPVPDGVHAIGGLAVGAGSAWVALDEGVIDDGSGGAIGRIDLDTNELVARIPVERTPWRGQLAATDDAVWAGSGDEVLRIDPASNAVAARIGVGDRFVAAMAADATAAWALTIDTSSFDPTEWSGSLVRIDPASNAIVTEIPLGQHPVGYLDELRLGAGSVWVLGVLLPDPAGPEYGSDLIRVDTATNEIAARIPVPGFDMEMGSDEVWVLFPTDGVVDSPGETWRWTRVDVSTNEPSPPFAFEVGMFGLRLVTPDALWAVEQDERGEVRVTSYDPSSLQVVSRSAPFQSPLHDAVVDASTRTVWVAAGNAVLRLDIE
jgi:hypothetical protein